MPQLLLDDIKRAALALTLKGEKIETLHRRKPFRLQVYNEGLQYTPESTDIPRLQKWVYIQRVLDRFNEIGSFRPADYKDITVNAAYLLAIIDAGNRDSITANV